MKIAIVGCGYVADLYMANLEVHPSVTIVAAFDIVPAHADRFHAYWKIPVYYSMAELLAAEDFDLVLNLTNPDSHFDVSHGFLEAGKHVYSEKPLAMSWDDATALVAFAAEKGLTISCAPCAHLSEAAQAMKRAIDAGEIGKPVLAYVEMDDNFVALSRYRSWISVSGAPWPAEDEFEVGCTLEHAGYCLSWLLLMFGPVSRIVSFASLQYSGKPIAAGKEAPDFSVTCLEFANGFVARLTCSILAESDHRFTVVGDKGIIQAHNIWVYRTAVTIRNYLRIRRRFMVSPFRRKVPLVPTGPKVKKHGSASHDFLRGPAEVAAALKEGRRSRMAADFVLHLNEVALAIGRPDGEYFTTTTFAPLDPIHAPII